MNLVREFHKVFNHPIAQERELPLQLDVRKLRISLLKEEYLKYVGAEKDNDILLVAKELGDMAYVVKGTCLVYGLDISTEDRDSFSLNRTLGFCDDKVRSFRKEMLADAMLDYILAEEKDNLVEIAMALVTIYRVLKLISSSYGINLNQVFEKIHVSNMTKLDPDTQKPVYRKDGKVLKGRAYVAPDFSGMFAFA